MARKRSKVVYLAQEGHDDTEAGSSSRSAALLDFERAYQRREDRELLRLLLRPEHPFAKHIEEGSEDFERILEEFASWSEDPL